MNEIDHWLERLFWIAMISIPFLAIWAGRIALRQVQTALQQVDAALQEAQTTKLFKILQHVEQQRVRDARDIVMTEIHRQEEEGKNWWEGDERLQRAAEQLCASYDHLGGIIKFDGPDRVGQYFLERWGEGIIPKLADPDSCCVGPTGTSIAKTCSGSMGYRRRAQARTVPRMSQCLRSLVLFVLTLYWSAF